MEIDFFDNNLYINSYTSELKPHHKLHLKYFGFIESSTDSLCVNDKVEKILNSTIDYFESEKIVFSLTSSGRILQ